METSNKIALAALIVSIIAVGVSALPTIKDYIKQAEIHGKMVSLTMSPKFKHSAGREGICYVLKLSLIVLNKNFDVKSIVVGMKYLNDERMYKGTIFRSNTFSTTFANKEGTYKLTIPSEQDILSLTALDRDVPTNYYLTFFVDKANFQDFEEIELTFTNYKKVEKKLRLYRKDIDSINALFEDEVWKKAN